MSKDIFTTYEISQICNVFMTTVANWIDEGKLSAYRTPGGHRRVMRKDLVSFLEKYNIPIPEALLPPAEHKILVVDDNLAMVQVIQQGLQQHNSNYIIHTADNGFEAGKQVAFFKPQLVILDVVLPGLDGLQVCQNLRKDPMTQDIHVIVMTAHNEDSTRREFEALDVNAYLIKPLNVDELVERVDSLLKKSATPV